MKILNILKFAVIGSIFCNSLICKDLNSTNFEEMKLYEAVALFLPSEPLKVGDDLQKEIEKILNDFAELSSKNFIILITEGSKKAPGMVHQDDGRELTLIDFLYELEFANQVRNFQFYGSSWDNFKRSHVQEANLCIELLRKRPDLLIDSEIQELIKASFIEDIYNECDDLSKFDISRLDEISREMRLLANNPFSLLSKAYPDNKEFYKATMPYAIPQTIVDFFIKITSALSKEPLKSKVMQALIQRDFEDVKDEFSIDKNDVQNSNEVMLDKVYVEEVKEEIL